MNSLVGGESRHQYVERVWPSYVSREGGSDRDEGTCRAFAGRRWDTLQAEAAARIIASLPKVMAAALRELASKTEDAAALRGAMQSAHVVLDYRESRGAFGAAGGKS